jgi:predicted small secreted protein
MSSVPPPEALQPQPQRATRGQPLGSRRLRLGVVAVLVALTFVASRSCQQDQIRISKEQAIATAKRQVQFDPTRVQVRMLRQGLNSRPNWIVSLSIPVSGAVIAEQKFKELALVRVDANTGKVVDVKVQR